MICPYCHGTGRHDPPSLLPCDACGGTGRLHCCDGLREQPEKIREALGARLVRRTLLPDGTLVDEHGRPVEIPPCRPMSDEEIEAAALADPDNQPLTAEDFARMKFRRRMP